ncbi:MAG: hypothetical protein QNJ69_03500 [Gammaproteobacteria bacterium]|nr:hypothetical protein [Gammaproteobacteria bacterium]
MEANLEKIKDIFVKYDLIPDDVSIEQIKQFLDETGAVDEDDESLITHELITEYADEFSIDCTVPKGGWISGQLLNEFYLWFENVVNVSKGKVKIEDVVLVPPKDEHDSTSEMSLSFKYEGKQYGWNFSLADTDDIIEGFAKWAYEALDGNFLYLADLPTGYYLNKNFIAEIEAFGVENEIHDILNREKGLLASILRWFKRE